MQYSPLRVVTELLRWMIWGTGLLSFSFENVYTFFPTAPASPNACALFGSTQSPRETYHTYEDARQVLRPSNARTAQRKTAKSGLKKIFGL